MSNDKFDKRFIGALDYNDVFIVPSHSGVSSRKLVDISCTLFSRNGKNNVRLKTPIIPANMKDVCEVESCKAFWTAGSIGCLHRFMLIEENVRMYKEIRSSGVDCFVSVGVNRDSKERALLLAQAGARFFIIDIAHGHSIQMGEMLEWFDSLPDRNDMIVMAGNVATSDGVRFLAQKGADVVKVGVANGAVCLTKNVTGCVVPSFSAILECSENQTFNSFVEKTPLVCDGGFREIGDFCKAIGAGATACMSGMFFVGCKESPAVENIYTKTKAYRGSASQTIQTNYRTERDQMPTPEGTTANINVTDNTVGKVLEDIAGGLQSSFSYTGARTTQEFQKKVQFGIRHNKS